MSQPQNSQASTVSRTQALSAWVGAYSGWIFDYYEIALSSIIIVPIRKEFGLSAVAATNIPATLILFTAIGGIVFGLLGDRLGRRNILYITISTYAIATILRALSPNYLSLLVFTAITGFGLGGEYGVGQALIAEMAPINRRGWWSGAFWGGTGPGIILSGLVGVFALPVLGWRGVLVASGLVSLVPLLVRLWTPESALWTQHKVVRRESIASVAFSPAFLVPFFLCLIIAIFQLFSYYLMTTPLPLYLTSKGITVTKASWYVFVLGLGVTTGSLLGAFFSDRIGRRLTGSVGALITTTSALLLYSIGVYTSALAVVLLYTLTIGTSWSAQIFGALFSEQFPTVVRALGTSAAYQVGRGFAYFAPILAASLYPVYGYGLVFLIGAMLSLVLAASFWILRKERRGQDVDF